MTRHTVRKVEFTDPKREISAGVSLWRQIADEIEQSIARGTFQPGTRLPGEIEIAERFGVNRHTVRRAIAALAERGMVRAERGSGTFIEQRRIPYPIKQRTRFSEIIGGAGHAVGARLTASSVEAADATMAKRLKIKLGSKLLRLELLRHADRIPLCAATTWLDAHRFPNAAAFYAADRSITRTLARFGVRNYTRKSTHVTAETAEAGDAGLLRIAVGRPLLVVNSVDIDEADTPVLATQARFAADRLELVIDS
ncbi:MAG: phosphonate metabolism transcriptional regulator PhnF [Hyphomicrobiales bacterium]